MSEKEKIKELTIELNKASKLYYNGKESFLTDKEFDKKLEELKNLEKKYNFTFCNSPTLRVGADPILKGIDVIEIKDKPMLSLDKVHSAEEIEKFSDGYDIIASIKCDGLSVRLIYENGELISANTRGNGTQGSDITEHIKHFLNVPLKIAKTETFIIDGEAIIYNKDFAIVNKNGEFKNNRNTASGSLALLDMSIVKNRRLSFIAWDIIKGGNNKCYHYRLEEAEELGFTVVPALALDCTKVEKEEIDNINRVFLEEAKEKGIPCDGVVWRINDIAAGDAKGQTSHHFLNAVAWKPENEEYETRLKYIDYDVSRNGVLTPVAVFDPVEIDGAEVSRASLHNISIMEDLLGDTPYCGQLIWIYKANMIIPQVKRSVKMDYGDIISHGGVTTGLGGDYGVLCPICGGFTSINISDSGVKTLVCDNPECEGKLAQRLDHYAGKKGLDIKGISRKTIEKLIEWGFVNELADFYKLDEHKTEWKSKPGFGEASVCKIMDAINQEGRHTTLEKFISALGIPLVGRKLAREIVKYYSTWEKFRNAIGSDWTEFEGFGPEINQSINKFDYTEADKIAAILDFEQPEIENNESLTQTAANQVFCITGRLTSGKWKNRNELKDYIESIGGKVVDHMSSNVNYLINNDFQSNSSKNQAAKHNGVPIITEEDFIKKYCNI